MGMGLPVIAPNWSGQTEFMTTRNSILLPVHSFSPAYPRQPHLLGGAHHAHAHKVRASIAVATSITFFHEPTECRELMTFRHSILLPVDSLVPAYPRQPPPGQ
jgi:hypothetical protein